MKKKLYHLTIFVLMMGMCFVNFNINTYATEKSTEGNELSSEFQKSLDSVSLAEIKKYFEESISELNSQKNQAESKEQRDSIDSDIKIYKNILQDIDNKKVNEESVIRGKQLLDNKSQIAKSDVVIMSLADDVRTAVLATIVVGDNMGYNFAARLLAHSLGATTNSTYDIWNTDSLVSNRVKASS